MKISVVIPNWNGASKLSNNLPAVFLSVKNYDSEVIVVDDDSADDSVERVKKEFPQVHLIKKKENSGFSTTVNLGVKEAAGEFVVLLNSDARPEKDFLQPALKHFNDQQVFSVGCNVGGGYAFGYFKDGFFWHGQKNLEKTEKNHRTLWASGGSGVFRTNIWHELGGLDPLFNPFYEEDVDLGYRATKRGYINIWDLESKVMHYKEPGVIATHFKKSTVEKIAQRNQLIFIWKNITSPQLIGEHKKSLLKMMLSHPKYSLIVFEAAKKWGEISQKRKIEQKEAELTDEEVFALFK